MLRLWVGKSTGSGRATIHKQRNHLEAFSAGLTGGLEQSSRVLTLQALGADHVLELPWKSGCGDRVPSVPSQPRMPIPSQAGLTGYSLRQLRLRASLEALAGSRSSLLPDSHSVFFWAAGQSGTMLLLFSRPS